MYRSSVQRFVSLGYPEEACALVEGLFSQLGHLHKLLSVGESSVLLAVRYDVLCDGGIDARNI